MAFLFKRPYPASQLTSHYGKDSLIGSLVEFLGIVNHWGVIVEVDDDDVYMIHLTSDGNVTRQRVADYAGDRKVRINNPDGFFTRPYPPDEIVKRAKSKLGLQGYNALFNNCEQFATWCRYGRGWSQQVIDGATYTTNPIGVVQKLTDLLW